jgi:hypothetical protein
MQQPTQKVFGFCFIIFVEDYNKYKDMAVSVLFTATRSADFKELKIADAGTVWGTGGNMAKEDVIDISLYIYGVDKDSPLKVIEFTYSEKMDYLIEGETTLVFSDSRLYSPSLYSPDGFFLAQLHITGGSVVETRVAFDSYFYLKNIVIDKLTSIDLPITTYYEANRKVTGDLSSLMELEYLSSTISVSREISWRKVYDFLAYNNAQ